VFRRVPGDTLYNTFEVRLVSLTGGIVTETFWLGLREIGDTLGGQDSVEICNALQGQDYVISEMHFNPAIE